ncbi:hypothetical protein [uncultured Tenacibaculum sp.]|uniref:hypothetical protein n=1 Tax=uncultured Tenacibaculum sp. TaxID=174713 RepID=UPI00262672A8|nr:hypothetical protein [uncultured Tenacibaculum sp.]
MISEEIKLDINKIKKYLKKGRFYQYFIDFVPTHDGMKREITEIVSKNRKIEEDKALNIRIFRVNEVKKFIESNDLQDQFKLI